MQYFIYAVLLIVIYFVLLAAAVAYKVIYPKKRTIEILERDFELYQKHIGWFEELNKENMQIKSRFGYEISSIYIKNPKETQNTMIICHGVTMLKESMIHYVRMFLELGYNAVVIDHRAHGQSGGKTVSYGYFEKYDLAEVIKWTRQKTSGKIGLMGESMGAGISMQTLELEEVDFIIEDCGYSSFDEQIKYALRNKKYAPLYPVYNFARFFVKVFGKYDLEKVSPVSVISRTQIPVMIIHGDNDKYVPFYMADIIYNSLKTEQKMKYYAKDSRHACSFYDNPEEYKNQVKNFLVKFDLPVDA